MPGFDMLVWNALKGFLKFWKNFLIGDSPVLALGVVIIVGVAYLLHDHMVLAPIATVTLVLALVTIAVWQKTRK